MPVKYGDKRNMDHINNASARSFGAELKNMMLQPPKKCGVIHRCIAVIAGSQWERSKSLGVDSFDRG